MSRRLGPILAALVSCVALYAADTEPLSATGRRTPLPAKLPPEVGLRLVRVRVWDPGFDAVKTRLPDGALTIDGRLPYYEGPPSTLSTADARTLTAGWIMQHLGPCATALKCQDAYPITVSSHDPTRGAQAPYTAGYLIDFRHEVHGVPVMHDGVRVRVVGDDIAWCWIRLHEVDGVRSPPRRYISSEEARRHSLDALATRLGPGRAAELSPITTQLAYHPRPERMQPARFDELVLARLRYRVRITTRGWDGRLTAWTVVVDAVTGDIMGCHRQ